MRVRTIDGVGDWTFGKGRNNYKKDINAVAQNIQTRLKSFLGDCFFDLEAGIDWFNLLGSKSELELKLVISSTILNTENVNILEETLVSVSSNRQLLIQYSVDTAYGQITNTVEV